MTQMSDSDSQHSMPGSEDVKQWGELGKPAVRHLSLALCVGMQTVPCHGGWIEACVLIDQDNRRISVGFARD
jgi:hypothetical protein